MKQLSNYISECIPNFKMCYERECYLNSMMDFFGDDLPDDVIESMYSEEYTDFILESLTTHDINKLKTKIEDEFGDNIDCNFINDKKQSLQIISDDDLAKSEKLKILVNVFGYYVTKSVKDTNTNLFVIEICPTYAKNANKIVSKNHGKLYHFTTAEHAKDIETSGLRCKSSRYRKFPKRIYLYASDKHLDKIPDIGKFIKKVTDTFDRRRYGLYVYKIDLNKLQTPTDINFYTDDYMDEEEAVYTYNNIPAECITKIDVDLNKLL